jgi:hypothetical protein
MISTRAKLQERQRKVDLLKQYCTVNQKERTALRTIMEVKIKSLVDSGENLNLKP